MSLLFSKEYEHLTKNFAAVWLSHGSGLSGMPFKGPGPTQKSEPLESSGHLKNKPCIPHFFYRNFEGYGFVIHLFRAYHKILIHRCDLYKASQISHNKTASSVQPC